MTVRLSVRISIRWGNAPPSEPTDTVVLSVDSHFMDLRINKADKTIDWAFAGTRDILSRDPLHCRWHHAIDSRLSFDPDEGKFQKLPNGDDLETGSMPCPENDNQVTPYEEVWRELHPAQGTALGWILESRGGSHTTFLGQYGGVYLAMRQTKDGSMSVLKQELVHGQDNLQWEKTYESGNLKLPLAGDVPSPGEQCWEVGNDVIIGGDSYVVRAIHRETLARL